jgi:integrase
VRLKGLKPVSKTFHQGEYASRREAEKAALAWGDAKERELQALRSTGGMREDVATLTLRGLVEEYLQDESTRALSTYAERARQCAWWVNKFDTVKALEFATPVRLRAARDELRAEMGPATTNRYLAAIRAVINFGRATGLVPPSVVWVPRLMLREPQGRKRYLTEKELSRALNEARKDAVIGGELLRCAVMFAVGVGCRQSEQLRVRWGDIDEKASTVAISVSKTDTSRRVHLPPAVSEALKALRSGKVRPLATAYVFADCEGKPLKQHVLVDAWERVRIRAGLPGVRWHDLRHSAASFLVQGGATLAEVANQLGHLNTATTARYAHLVEGAKPTGADALNEKLRG